MLSKIILASASPRRREILSVFLSDFEVKAAEIIEKVNDGERPEDVVMALAFEKAISVADLCDIGDIIIAADTIVVKDQVLGKPSNYDDAFRMLQSLQDNIHFVITGIAVLQVGSFNKIASYSKTKVKIKHLTKESIKRYIDTGEVFDKAGSYAIQGKGSAIVEWIEGDYFNVVGLPISKLLDILKQYFNIELF